MPCVLHNYTVYEKQNKSEDFYYKTHLFSDVASLVLQTLTLCILLKLFSFAHHHILFLTEAVNQDGQHRCYVLKKWSGFFLFKTKDNAPGN